MGGESNLRQSVRIYLTPTRTHHYVTARITEKSLSISLARGEEETRKAQRTRIFTLALARAQRDHKICIAYSP